MRLLPRRRIGPLRCQPVGARTVSRVRPAAALSGWESRGQPLFGGQHYEHQNLACAAEEWEHAAKWISMFQAQAAELPCWALEEALEMAAGVCEMGQESTDSRRRVIWEDDPDE